MVTNTERKYNGFLKIDLLTVVDESGNEFKRELMVRPDAVAALVFDTTSKEFILTEQWRPGSNSNLIEIVAGTLDKDNEDPIDAVRREIVEEIGYNMNKIELIGDCYVSPGGTSERVKIYYVEASEQTHKGGGLEEENEGIKIIKMGVEEFKNYDTIDAKTMIAKQYFVLSSK